RYRKFLQDWQQAGWPSKPNIAYCTIVYVGETDEQAMDAALVRASRAYEGFLAPAQPGETLPSLFDPDYLMKHELVFIGSPKTVAERPGAPAEAGVFNTFMGEFNFSDLPKADLMRSIRLFGEQVIPALRSYEPF